MRRRRPRDGGTGDWHDVIVLDDDRIAVVVGDVVGNGPVAAATMGKLSSALAAYLREGHGPAAALDRLSGYATRLDQAPGSTAICLVLDTAAGELRGACAGHPPPLLLEPDQVNRGGGIRFWAGLRDSVSRHLHATPTGLLDAVLAGCLPEGGPATTWPW